MTTHGATGATPRASREDAEAPLISPHTQPAVTSVAPYVCDYNGIAYPVKVPVGTTLSELVRAAFQEPMFKKGDCLGFEDGNLSMIQPVTADDGTRWTADRPLKLKYKRRLMPDLVNDAETELEEKASNFAARHNGWIVAFIIGAANAVYTHASSDDRSGSDMG